MKAGGGKAKGSQFERDVCVALSTWITDGEKIDCLWRSAMSGGRATVMKGKVRQAGDITAVSPEGHKLTDLFYIECKHLQNISLDSLIKRKGPLLTIWHDTVAKARQYKREPMLIFRQNRWPTIVAIEQMSFLGEMGTVFCDAPLENMILIRFDDMLNSRFPYDH